jgi:hypothetical protein
VRPPFFIYLPRLTWYAVLSMTVWDLWNAQQMVNIIVACHWEIRR